MLTLLSVSRTQFDRISLRSMAFITTFLIVVLTRIIEKEFLLNRKARFQTLTDSTTVSSLKSTPSKHYKDQ
jgi:hypothetical protein